MFDTIIQSILNLSSFVLVFAASFFLLKYQNKYGRTAKLFVVLDFWYASDYLLESAPLISGVFYFFGVPRPTRTAIGCLGGNCSIQLSYEHIYLPIILYFLFIFKRLFNLFMTISSFITRL